MFKVKNLILKINEIGVILVCLELTERCSEKGKMRSSGFSKR